MSKHINYFTQKNTCSIYNPRFWTKMYFVSLSLIIKYVVLFIMYSQCLAWSASGDFAPTHSPVMYCTQARDMTPTTHTFWNNCVHFQLSCKQRPQARECQATLLLVSCVWCLFRAQGVIGDTGPRGKLGRAGLKVSCHSVFKTSTVFSSSMKLTRAIIMHASVLWSQINLTQLRELEREL